MIRRLPYAFSLIVDGAGQSKGTCQQEGAPQRKIAAVSGNDDFITANRYAVCGAGCLCRLGMQIIRIDRKLHLAVPVITTTAETTLRWAIDGESVHKTVSAGTWEILELELRHGDNTVSVTGEGTTTFTYRQGRL